MDLDHCLKVHNVVVLQLNCTKPGQMTNLYVIFYVILPIYKLDTIYNSTQSRAQPQSGLYTIQVTGIHLCSPFYNTCGESNDPAVTRAIQFLP